MLYLVTLEPLENRYTAQWKRWFQEEFPEAVEIDGEVSVPNRTDNVGFLDFSATNVWKARQIENMAKLFQEGKVSKGDVFFFYDAWHYGVIALKYMAALLNVPIQIVAFWHAGTYTPGDLLNRPDLISTLGPFEQSLLKSIDVNVVATFYHKKLLCETYPNATAQSRVVVWGMPFKIEEILPYAEKVEKQDNLVVFPHRLSEEKGYPCPIKEIQKDLAQHGVELCICMEENLTKEEYYKTLAKASVVLSLSEEETFGIAVMEALFLDCVPILPYHLSYPELYSELPNDLFYPSEWLKVLKEDAFRRGDLSMAVSGFSSYVRKVLKHADNYRKELPKTKNFVRQNYLNFWKHFRKFLAGEEEA